MGALESALQELHEAGKRMEISWLWDGGIEVNAIPILTRLGKRFPQLLYDPFRTRSAGDIEVQDSAPPVFNHEKAIQEFESHCRNGKEIHGSNCLTMISEKRKPTLAWNGAAPESP